MALSLSIWFIKKKIRETKRWQSISKALYGDDIRGKRDDDFCLVSSPDLLQYTPNGKWLPTPINVSLVERIVDVTKEGPKKRNKVLLAHYPYYKNNPRNYIDYYSSTLRSLRKKINVKLLKFFMVHIPKLWKLYPRQI